MSVTVTGMPRLDRNLRRLLQIADDVVNDGLEGPAEDMARDISRRAPTDEGDLARSVVVVEDADGDIAIGFRKPIGNHAHLVEYGYTSAGPGKTTSGRRIPPNPFIRPAVDQGKGRVVKAASKTTWQAITRQMN